MELPPALLRSPRFCTWHCLRFCGLFFFFLFLAHTAVLVRGEQAFYPILQIRAAPQDCRGLPYGCFCRSVQWFWPDWKPKQSWVHVSKPRSDLKGFIYCMSRGLCSFLDSTFNEGHRKPFRVHVVSCYRGAGIWAGKPGTSWWPELQNIQGCYW